MTAELQSAKLRTWVVLSFGDDRQHAGNAGYDDDPHKWYSYDSYVANHRQIANGDFLILCDRVRALGIAQVATMALCFAFTYGEPARSSESIAK